MTTYIKIQWMIVLFVSVVSFAWIWVSSVSFYYSFNNSVEFCSVLLMFFALYFLFLKSHFEIFKKLLLALSWSIGFNHAALALSYIANTINRPLVTSSLADMDDYLGFYVPTLVRWFSTHPWLDIIFFYIYGSLLYQNLLTLIYFSIPSKTKYLESYMMQYMIASLLTIVISAVFPAVGTHAWYDFAANSTQSSDLERLYELRQNIVDLGTFNGIVEFPSFHTAVGVLITYAFRHQSKFIFIPILILNILMIFSCLSHGGHFLVDILGGIIVAAIAIVLERVICRNIRSLSFEKIKNEEEKIPKALEPINL